MSALAIIHDADAAAVALSPMRRRVLEALREPGSATTVGESLGLARQKVNYHLRALEDVGLVQHVEDRKKGNCTERIVQATAAHYLIAPSVLGDLGEPPEEAADRLSSEYLAAASARTVNDLAELGERAANAGKRLPTFTLETAIRFAEPGDQAEFLERLSNAAARLISEYHRESAEGGRWFRLVLGAHPALPRTDSSKASNEEKS